jgi:hypothetical protein
VNASAIRQNIFYQPKTSIRALVAFGLEPFKVDGASTYASFSGATINCEKPFWFWLVQVRFIEMTFLIHCQT